MSTRPIAGFRDRAMLAPVYVSAVVVILIGLAAFDVVFERL